MSDRNTIPENPQSQMSPVTMGQRQRQVAGWGGALVVLGGVAATFLTENQGGTVALLAAGTVLLVLGLVGRIPDKGNVGQVGFEYGPTRAAYDLLRHEDPVVREAVAEEVVESAGETPPNPTSSSGRLVVTAESVLRERDLVRNLYHQLASALPDVDVSQGFAAKGPDGRTLRPDLTVRGLRSDGSHWIVPIEVTLRAGARKISQVAHYALALDTSVAVLVAPDDAGRTATIRVLSGIWVFVAPAGDMTAVIHSVTRAIEVAMTGEQPSG